MKTTTGAYVTLMSEFTVSFDAGYLEYVDRDSAKVSKEKELLTSANNQFEKTEVFQSFDRYLDYMDRKSALTSKEKLSPDEKYSLQKINEKIEKISPVEKKFLDPEHSGVQEKLDQLQSGMFDLQYDDLSQEQVEQYKKLFNESNKNQSVLFQDVVSFETDALILAGIYDPATNELNREPLIEASRNMLQSLYETESLNDSTISVGEIHYNTNHFHIHFATTEVNPTRQMVYAKDNQRFERKGVRDEYTLEKMRSVFANSIFDRSKELEKINNLRDSLRSEIKDELNQSNDTSLGLLNELKEGLPDNKAKWNAKNLTPENRKIMNTLIDELMKNNGNFKEFKSLVEEENRFKQASYGTLAKNKESFYHQRMYGNDGIYYRLGNSILQEIKKNPKNINRLRQHSDAVNKIIASSPSYKQSYDKIAHDLNVEGRKNKSATLIQRGEHSIDRAKPEYRKRSPPKLNFFRRRSLNNEFKHLERVTSNEYQKYKNEMEFRKVQQQIDQAKYDQGSNLL